MKVRYEDWQATEKPIMESELPPGVRYSKADMPGAEFVAAEYGRRTVARFTNGNLAHRHGQDDRLRSTPVTILEWPSWCGPHLATKTERPKMSEACKMVGAGGIVAVVSTNGMGEVQTFDRWDIDRLSVGDGRCDPYYTFLGYLIAEENS